jgi:hypothetical protein
MSSSDASKPAWGPALQPAVTAAALVLSLSACGARQPAAPVAVTERLELHSDPWINLHHFLYQWTRADRGLGEGRQAVAVPERSSLGGLSGPDRRAWEQALAFYRDSVAGRSHFDSTMLRQKRLLVQLGGNPRSDPQDVIPGIGAALDAAMPVYLARWWPAHDSANRAWIAGVTRLLRRHEAGFVALTERAYGAAWPSSPIRVDVAAYANPRAGYTSAADRHIVMFSTDPGAQGLYALEMLLHEVQHTPEVGDAGRDALARAFEAAGLEQPRNLWHGVIFATAGDYTRTVAEREGLPTHEPYWMREAFGELQGWSAVVTAVEDDWLPVLRGAASRDAACSALARRFSGGAARRPSPRPV